MWLGLVEREFSKLSRAAQALQVEFGVDAGSATGFLDQDVIWGILLGPWANDSVGNSVGENLREYSPLFAEFLADNEEYILLTKDTVLETPDEEEIRAISDTIDQGFALTRDLELRDLPDLDPLQATCETLSQVTPLYRILTGIDNAPPVTSLSQLLEPDKNPPAMDTPWDIETLGAATTLDREEIEDAVNRLMSSGCSSEEARKYVQRYLREMLQGDGLFAVFGVGPSSGRALVEADVKTLDELEAANPVELAERSELSVGQIRRFQHAAQTGSFASFDPGDEQLAVQLTGTVEEPAGDAVNERPPNTDQGVGGQDHHPGSTGTGSTEDSRGRSEETTRVADKQALVTPAELPVPDHNQVPVPGGDTVYPNHLSEYYESFRSMKQVLERVFQIPGINIDPDDRSDPRVQYYILLNACIGFGSTSAMFTGYGPQHQDRIPFSIREYRTAFGDAESVTDYQVIDVEPFTDDTHDLLYNEGGVRATREFVRPCVPGTRCPLLELPGSLEELQESMQLLATFPAYPPLPTENGVSDRTIPVSEIYQTYFEDLDDKHKIDCSTLPGSESSSPTGPVPSATPTSSAEAESTLVDFGRLSHLFRRVTAPEHSPANRALNVFALDWYRPESPSFAALEALAKHGNDDPVDAFRPRLQDLVHRRFLLDTWDYDYITVFPGHEAGSHSPQLVELAMDAVLETDILYSPLLERTETVERQREKSKEERQRIAVDPSASLRARAELDGDTVILFDDICTTGSSLFAGAHLLRQAGAERVVCLTLGLTPGGPLENVSEITYPEATASEIIAGLDK